MCHRYSLPGVKKGYRLTWTAGFASNPGGTLPDRPDPNPPFSLAIAGDSDLVFDVMPDTAKHGMKAQITVDGRVSKNVTYGPFKAPFVCRLKEGRPDPYAFDECA